jgi:hypothetical protein
MVIEVEGFSSRRSIQKNPKLRLDSLLMHRTRSLALLPSSCASSIPSCSFSTHARATASLGTTSPSLHKRRKNTVNHQAREISSNLGPSTLVYRYNAKEALVTCSNACFHTSSRTFSTSASLSQENTKMTTTTTEISSSSKTNTRPKQKKRIYSRDHQLYKTDPAVSERERTRLGVYAQNNPRKLKRSGGAGADARDRTVLLTPWRGAPTFMHAAAFVRELERRYGKIQYAGIPKVGNFFLFYFIRFV